MPGFSISPVGPFPTPADGEFPNYIQLQNQGTNLGAPDATTINFTGSGVTATRGVGENASTISVEIDLTDESIDVMENGITVVEAVRAINFTGNVSVTSESGNTANVEISPFALSWRIVDGDGVIAADDVGNGILMTANTGAPALSIPADTIPEGDSVLVVQRGAAQVMLMPVSGLALVYREDAFSAALAGQGAAVTLTGLPEGEILLTGDMEAL